MPDKAFWIAAFLVYMKTRKLAFYFPSAIQGMQKGCPKREAFRVCHNKDTFRAGTYKNMFEVGTATQGHPENETYYCTNSIISLFTKCYLYTNTQAHMITYYYSCYKYRLCLIKYLYLYKLHIQLYFIQNHISNSIPTYA